jgi:L,D-transpeptidase YbiS
MSDQDSEKNENLVENTDQVSAEVPSENENLVENIETKSAEAPPEIVKKSFLKTWFGKLLFWITFLALLFVAVFILPVFLQRVIVPIYAINLKSITGSDAEMAEDKSILEGSISKLQTQLTSYVPDSYYLIINSTDNEFSLKKAGELIRQGKCSTGSYTVLEDPKKGKKYTFITPKGRRKVLSKVTDPVWTKPNWAFIEEGLPVPSATHPSRFEEGVLGDYALKLGDGYMIHGTIWQRYLGLPVTHGCVRLNDADLEVIYKSLNKGSYVFIY